MDSLICDAITAPARLWTPEELRERPALVPREAGVYGWYFRELPSDMDVSNCVKVGGQTLLYVGIAPGRSGSSSNLRRRLRQHCRDRGSSTLRRTLAALLAERLGLVPGSGTRGPLRIGDEGERRLSGWISANMAVAWAVTPDPWLAERDLIETLDLPLNLMHNSKHPFRSTLTKARDAARKQVLADLSGVGSAERNLD
jgi:hypothetical protein